MTAAELAALEDEILFKKQQIELVKTQITKLRSTIVASYSYSGNSAAYISLDQAKKDLSALQKEVQMLELKKDGVNPEQSMFQSFVRFR
ncbi:hypothetical protein [Francisella philomiragia]|uniref:Uncharacterized protein n=1 Tax=Francisella philomiragia TaxID=28110 RepID=A0ABS1GCW2_9GAMM|nr:hypothetical protein [Francisella philomiragia]MBK2258991.1 hypothetical protein [Francisella philomiragia]MBK2302682.1 hypothetical protein [Francisella philomiragia]